ncbi:MAG: hypothetical protein KME64_05010 [Scytonematopsis contorta HA4267-MV1]|jgi:hypothetical protein|nr:hypothetical protein [Scytonematopsis contorta HA4267-MV1]
MNISNAVQRIFRSKKPEDIVVNNSQNGVGLKPPDFQQFKDLDAPRFDFKLFVGVTSFLIASVGLLNWLVDPLWYGSGNRLTGKNFAFNERVSKTNLFLRTKGKSYDCLILGSSRVIALKASAFSGQNCFNYAVKGGEIPDFISIAKFVKDNGIYPKRVYVGVDEFNFVKKDKVNKDNTDVSKLATPSIYQAYFSSDVFMFSLMTLLGQSPDPANYYNSKFEMEEFPTKPIFKPEFFPAQSPQQCDLSQVNSYAQLRNIFPNAKFIGYVPPRAAWSVINETYARNITGCTLEGFHKVAQLYDEMYDFSIPSPLTKNPDSTFDGSHFSPAANDKVAEVLQGKPSDISLKVHKYSLSEYQKLYKGKLKEFLKEQGELKRWKD